MIPLLDLFTLGAIAAGTMQADPPRSTGPHRNINEMVGAPPELLLPGDGSTKQEVCLTIALASGIGGAPVVLHANDGTIIASLIDRTFGKVALMIKIRPDHVIEIRGHDEPQLRSVRACLQQGGQPS